MSELEAEVKRIAELHAQQIQGNHKEWLEMFNDQAFIAAAPQMASLIAKLWAENQQLTKALKVRSKQIGVACLKHDLTHALTCGHCYAQQDAIIQQQREALALVGRIFYYGGFTPETSNEAELMHKLRELGFWYGTEDQALAALDAALNHE